MSDFVGGRLSLARAVAGMTQTALAEKVRVVPSFISQLESGQRQAREDLLSALADTLGFSPRFFSLPIRSTIDAEEGHFRGHHTSVQKREQVAARATCFIELVDYLDVTLRLPDDSFPRWESYTMDGVEEIAQRCRKQWGIATDAPIANISRFVEHAGGVIALVECPEKIYAFSRSTAGNRKVMFVGRNTNTASRAVFSIAHECGHLVLHGGMATGEERLEREADRFAAAFLLPRAAFFREFPRGRRIQWELLFAMKRRWRVSVAAILHRAMELGLMPPEQYITAQKLISHKGWRKEEPAEFPFVESETIPRAMESLRRHFNLSVEDVAAQLGWSMARLGQIAGVSPSEFDEVTGEHRVTSHVRELRRLQAHIRDSAAQDGSSRAGTPASPAVRPLGKPHET